MTRPAAPSPGKSASLGFRIRTGYAMAVLLEGPVASPHPVARRQIDLCDMGDLDARQPYHVVMEQGEKRGMALVRRTTNTARASALHAVRELVKETTKRGRVVHSVGLVVGSEVDPNALANPHIRAHALEGRLYRDAVERAASTCGLRCTVLVERNAYETATRVLGRRPHELKAATVALGQSMGRPWGAQEKMAALGAWVALASRHGARGPR